MGWIPIAETQRALQGSGLDGMHVRPFTDSEEDKARFKVIPLEGKSRREVQTTAEYLGSKAFGIVHTRRGWAIRVLSTAYADLVQQLAPDEATRLTSEYFEVSGIPTSFSKAAVQKLLVEWQGAEPVRPMERAFNGFLAWIFFFLYT